MYLESVPRDPLLRADLYWSSSTIGGKLRKSKYSEVFGRVKMEPLFYVRLKRNYHKHAVDHLKIFKNIHRPFEFVRLLFKQTCIYREIQDDS